MTNALSDLELELRLLPGVVNVGIGAPEPTGHVPVTLVAVEPETDLAASATRIARTVHGAASVEVLDLSQPRPTADVVVVLPSDERVALLTSAVDEEGRASVHLSWHGASSGASEAGGALIGTARATLGALRGLGIDVEAAVASVSTGRGVVDSPVRVILRSEMVAAEFIGIARGGTAPESAARATLAAFNRYVAKRAATER